MGHRRAPGVEHSSESDPGAEVLGIGGDGGERCCCSFEQQRVNHVFVGVSKVADGRWQGEHDVGVLDGQEIGLSCCKPALSGGPLTLRTMSITTRVIGVLGRGAVYTAQHMAAEGGAAALLDGGHHLELTEAQVSGLSAAPRRAVRAQDVRDFESRS